MPRLNAAIPDRIIARSSIDSAGCWIWQLRLDRDGYGQAKIHGRSMLAHRASYEAFVGPVPEGLTIYHLCRKKSCVNPAHLEAVSNRENILRSDGVTARAARKTHCPQGHPYDELNTWRDATGARHCRTCGRIRNRRR